MKTVMAKNISRSESFRRYAIGTIVLAAFMTNPTLPAWVALIALYPFATAMNQWDPLNALFDAVIRAINLNRIKHAAKSLPVRTVRVRV